MPHPQLCNTYPIYPQESCLGRIRLINVYRPWPPGSPTSISSTKTLPYKSVDTLTPPFRSTHRQSMSLHVSFAATLLILAATVVWLVHRTQPQLPRAPVTAKRATPFATSSFLEVDVKPAIQPPVLYAPASRVYLDALRTITRQEFFVVVRCTLLCTYFF